MGRDRMRVLACGIAAIALIVAGALAMTWYRMAFEPLGGGAVRVAIDLRILEVCQLGACTRTTLSPVPGMFPTLAAVTLWSSLAVAALVACQAGVRIASGSAYDPLSKLGYMVGVMAISIAVAAAYFFGPDSEGAILSSAAQAGVALQRTGAPLTLIGGLVVGVATLYMTISPESSDHTAAYKPMAFAPATPVSGARTRPSAMRIPFPERTGTFPILSGDVVGSLDGPRLPADRTALGTSPIPRQSSAPPGERPTVDIRGPREHTGPHLPATRTIMGIQPSRERTMTGVQPVRAAVGSQPIDVRPALPAEPAPAAPPAVDPAPPVAAPSAETRPPSAEARAPSADRRPPSADSRPPSADRRAPSADSRPPSADTRPPSADSRPPSADTDTPRPNAASPASGRVRPAAGTAPPAAGLVRPSSTRPAARPTPVAPSQPRDPAELLRKRVTGTPPIIERNAADSAELLRKRVTGTPTIIERNTTVPRVRESKPSIVAPMAPVAPIAPVAPMALPRERAATGAPAIADRPPDPPPLRERAATGVHPIMALSETGEPIIARPPTSTGTGTGTHAAARTTGTGSHAAASTGTGTHAAARTGTHTAARAGSGPIPAAPEVARAKSPSIAPAPAHLRNRLSYVAVTADLTAGGIDARREDGSARLVLWRDVVGVVARRLPPCYDDLLFVDIVSSAGSTLRIVPWTRLTGEPIAATPDERPRAVIERVTARCPTARVDPATRHFVETGDAAQLPDVDTLRAHDARLA